jgi:hypothetical protein
MENFDFAITASGKLVTPQKDFIIEVKRITRKDGGFYFTYGDKNTEKIARYVSSSSAFAKFAVDEPVDDPAEPIVEPVNEVTSATQSPDTDSPVEPKKRGRKPKAVQNQEMVVSE